MTQDEGSVGRIGGRPRRMRARADTANALSAHTQQRIGVHLRALYDAVVDQPVPDRFKDLIARLEASDEDGPQSNGAA